MRRILEKAWLWAFLFLLTLPALVHAQFDYKTNAPALSHPVGNDHPVAPGKPPVHADSPQFSAGDPNQWKANALSGDTVAMVSLGNLYLKGSGVTTNVAEAAKWFRSAASSGETDAMVMLGDLYLNGKGVSTNFSEAMKWFREAANLGEPDAMAKLGNMYLNGRGVTTNVAEAVKWFRKAAELDNPLAMNNLADCLAKGNGVKKDEAEADKWRRKASEVGPPPAVSIRKYSFSSGVRVYAHLVSISHAAITVSMSAKSSNTAASKPMPAVVDSMGQQDVELVTFKPTNKSLPWSVEWNWGWKPLPDIGSTATKR